jgi:hypothetical protein
MKNTVIVLTSMLAAGSLSAAPAGGAAVPPAPQADGVRVYYFGNSLTGSTAPELHTALGKSAGKEWIWDLMAVAGGQLWQYRDQFELDAKLGPVGAFTLDAELAKKAPYAAQKFLTGDWNAIVLQPFGTKLKLVQNEMWGKTYDHERDFGDLAAARYLIDLALKKNPRMRVFVYQDWPGMSLGVDAALGKTGKELNHAQMEPIRRSFDYARSWFRRYNESEPNWDCGAATHSYEWLLMDKLIEAYPELWKDGRLRMIPVGDIYHALDRKMRAGAVPGVLNIGEYYTDGLHNRAGMAAYTCSAAFYTMLFGEKPHGLDYSLYNNLDAYGKDWGNGKDEHNDSGLVLEITPERAAVIHDTIWDVANAHPYTRISDSGSREALEAYDAAIPAPEPQRILEYGYKPCWSAMPAWQPALDRTAGKHSAWAHACETADWIQQGGCEWLAGVFREKKHPYGFPPYHAEMEEPNHETHRHQGLCLPSGNPTDAEVGAFVYLAKHFIEKRPDGFVLGYFPWPALSGAAALKKELKLEPWQIVPEDRMASLRAGFDYAAAWNAPEAAAGTAAGAEAFVAKLRAADADIARRFRPIPAGALLAALDAKLKAGALPGVGGVGEFYKDDVLLRTGLPRYALAALRFAVVHKADPKGLDASFFNEPKTYPPDAMDPARKRGRGRAYVVVRDDDYDNGPHFPITPAGKKLVDDTVREIAGW